jgi:hypothetical protein
MKNYFLFPNIAFILVLLMASCSIKQENNELFRRLSHDRTGISFSNTIIENDSVNVLDFYYCYNGGGVGIGDFDNDGLQDIFFTGNMVSSKLYLNKGYLKFEDITEAAGVATKGWIMGISLVDINNDGWLDIYLNVAGPGQKNEYRNLLFINEGLNSLGIPSFSEAAAQYGLADNSFSVQSAFLDYDRDGDLDMFLLTNRVDFSDKSFIHPSNYPATKGVTTDRLYKNIGIPDTLDHPFYIDVSEEAGIKYEGYGLGLAIDDLNADGWPDIYVANDFMPNDLIYINQQDGTFNDYSSQSQRHQSYNGMGVDIADINNDLLPDIMVVDMLPKSNERRKSMMSGMNYEKFLMEQEAGYVPQFMRNTLQLNQGKDAEGTTHFSDISQLAGVHDTDWSWAPLMADFDNDGLRDIYITNGFVKDITDLDFINYKAPAVSMFGPQESKQEKRRKTIELLKGVKVSNFIFKNQGDFSFQDLTEDWGVDIPSYSNGAAYADLDNDGDLDIIINNINDNAFIFENQSKHINKESHFLQLLLRGSEKNRSGLGAKVIVYTDSTSQYYYHSPVKGYLSSMHTPVHFGIGKHLLVDSLKITWNDGKCQLLKNIKVNQVLTIDYQEAKLCDATHDVDQNKAFRKANNDFSIQYQHIENRHNDFNRDPLLPRMFSRDGPGIAIGDIDLKNGQDFFIGGSAGNAGTLFLQTEDETFTKRSFDTTEVNSEDMGVLFFDCDNDGDLDLYVVSGGSEFKKGAEEYQDRLYINDGAGNFTRNIRSLPRITSSGSCVVGVDFDKDGDIDLFIGGRYDPGAYPTAPKSFLLENRNGTFHDKTEEKAKDLASIGMVTSAVWTDFDDDGWIDLIVVGEWMPITFFQNQRGKLVNITAKAGLANTKGWWNSIYPADIDQDGDIDYIVGNMGLNNDYKPTPEFPINLFAYDYDANGKVEPFLFRYQKNKKGKQELVPFHGRDDLLKQLVMLKKKFQNYESYAHAGFAEIIPPDKFPKTNKFTAERFESCIIENKGGGKFILRALPVEVQLSSVYGILADDFNQDDKVDLLLAGNSYASEVMYGWQDASLGLCLWGDGNGYFTAVKPENSGFFLNKDIKGFASLHNKNGEKIVLAAANSDSLVALKSIASHQGKVVWAQPQDAYAEILYKDGTKRKTELYYGAGYLSQSSRSIEVSDRVQSIIIVDFRGNRRGISF